jgi:ferredoxin
VTAQIRVDRDKCSGHARCFAVDPGLFPIDESGFVTVGVEDVPAGQEANASAGALACPEGAISISGLADPDGSAGSSR